MYEGRKPVGIKVDDENQIKVITELIINSLPGLLADLGSGLFVVTSDAAKELAERGVDYKPVVIHNGVPPFVREFIRDTCREKGVVSPF